MAALEDIDLSPPEPTLDPDVVRYLYENFARIQLELAGAGAGGDGGWTDLTLLNSWVTFSSLYPDPRYRIHPGGLIEIQGGIKNGTTTAATPLFAMPEFTRSDFRQVFAVPISGAIGSIYFDAALDQVLASVVSATFTSINIMYYADDYTA